MALPQEFEQRMERLLGAEYPAFQEALARPQARGLRVSPLKIAPDTFAKIAPFTLTPVPWAKEGFFYPETQRPGRHPYYEAGVYYIQEPSAMVVGALADAKPGERILDLCAAPGGKTTHLAGRMQGKGVLIANEIHSGRAAILAQSVERMGIANCIVCNETPAHLAERFPHYFDKIIVDAPCSGEGMFRKDDNPAQQEWTAELPTFCAERQADILDQAAKMLRGGGKLIYSTCTFAPEEDEGTLSRFLERNPSFEMIEVNPAPACLSPGHPEWAEQGHPDMRKAFRLWPHKLDGEGHFAAVLQRKDTTEGTAPMTQKKRSRQEQENLLLAKKLLLEQLQAIPTDWELEIRKDKVFLIPAECRLDVSGLKVKAYGIEAGILKKNRLEPAHALSHAMPMEAFRRTYALTAEEAEQYLRGDTFACAGEKGWTAVMMDGFVLGWGKAAGGMMKNHYPKGLRWVGK